MVTTNFYAKEICLRIVYYGSPLSGKKTNLHFLHKNWEGAEKEEIKCEDFHSGKVYSFRGKTKETLAEMKVIYQVTSVSGDLSPPEAQKKLAGADGVIFVIDNSQELELQMEYEKSLQEFMDSQGKTPVVWQYNKKDSSPRFSPSDLEKGEEKLTIIAANALDGEGVKATWKLIADKVFKKVQHQQANTTQGIAGFKLKRKKEEGTEKKLDSLSQTGKLPGKWKKTEESTDTKTTLGEAKKKSSKLRLPKKFQTSRIENKVESKIDEGCGEETFAESLDDNPDPKTDKKFRESSEKGEKEAKEFINTFLMADDESSPPYEKSVETVTDEDLDSDFLSGPPIKKKEPELLGSLLDEENDEEDFMSSPRGGDTTIVDIQALDALNELDQKNRRKIASEATEEVSLSGSGGHSLFRKSSSRLKSRNLQLSYEEQSSEKSLQQLHQGKKLENLNIDVLDLSNLSFSTPVHISRCCIGKILCDGTDFNGPVTIEDTVITDSFSLSGEIGSIFREALTLKRLEIEGEISWTRIVAGKIVSILDSTWHSVANMNNAIFEHDFFLANNKMAGIAAEQAQFRGVITVSGCHFEKEMNFKDVTIEGKMSVSGSHFYSLHFNRSHFQSHTEFVNTNFEKVANFQSLYAESGLNFEGCVFNGRCKLADSYIKGTLGVRRSEFFDDTSFNCISAQGLQTFESVTFYSSVDMANTLFQQVEFNQNTFKGSTSFFEATFQEKACFLETCFEGNVYFSRAIFSQKVDFTECEFKGHLAINNIIGDYIVIGREQVEGKLLSEDQKDYAQALQEYLTLKRIMEQQGNVTDRDWAHYKAKQMQSKQERFSLLHPMKSSQNLLRWLFLDLGSGYGTKPQNVIFLSLFWVIAFTALYGLVFPSQVEGASLVFFGDNSLSLVDLSSFSQVKPWADAFELSLKTFLPGNPGQIANSSYFLLAQMAESFLGLMMIFLFVLTFVRKTLHT